MLSRKNGKRGHLLHFITLLALLMLAVACGGQAQETGSGGEETPADSGEETPADTGDTGEESSSGSGDSVELTYWISADPTLEQATDEILAAFQAEHPNISVRREAFPFTEYFQKLLTSFGSGSGPDVFWIDVQTAPFASRGVLLPEDQFVDDEFLDPLIPSSLIEGTWNDTLYAVPLHQLTEALFINKQMAEEAGLELPTTVDDAWTWDEFVEIAKQLTVREGNQTTVWGFGYQRAISDWNVLPVIFQNGGQPLSPDLKTATGYLNSPESVEAMQWFQDLYQTHQVASVDPVPDGFPNGQIAMFQAPSTYRAVLANNFPDFEYVIVPLFRGPARCAVTTGGWNVGIAQSTEDPEAAWELVNWLTNETHSEWVEKSGYLPVREEVLAEPRFSEPPLSIFTEALQQCAANRPPTEHYQFFQDTFNAAVVDIALGGDVQQILDNAAAELDRELAK